MLVSNLFLGLFIALQLLDVFISYKGLKTNTLGESNPVSAFLIKKIGTIPAMFLSKTVLIGTALYLHNDSTEWFYMLGVINILYAWLVIKNYLLAKKHGAI